MLRRDYVFKRGYRNSYQNTKVFKYYVYIFFSRVFYYLLVILSVLTINIAQSNKNFNTATKNIVLSASKPIFLIAEMPFNALFNFAVSVKNVLLTNIYNKKLTEENIELKKLYLESLAIKAENDNLKKILNFKDELKTTYDFVTSKVYLNPRNNMNNTSIINIGVNEGLQNGNLVIGTNKGLVGRVINVGNNYSDILMLDDINSKIPVRTINTKEKMILSGNNSGEYLDISYYNSKVPHIVEGDLVYTSGDSNIIPDGIFVGTIKKINNKYVVKMLENTIDIYDVVIITSKNEILQQNQ